MRVPRAPVSWHLLVLGRAADALLGATARALRLLPIANPRRHGVEVIRDLPYRGTGRRAHLLDVYRPSDRASRHSPALIYIHGGAFGILTKDSHWMMALMFARRGYTVFNISYRLAPADPFPCALEDACAAYEWVVRNAPSYGGDPQRLVLAGDSAGANLAAALAVVACYRRDEPHARMVWNTSVVPRAVLPASAIFQVTDTARFRRRRRQAPGVSWFLENVERNYLRGTDAAMHELADPVCILERGAPPDRPLPPFFAAVGTRDPLLDDTRRLESALRRLGVRCDARYYPGEIHVFHAAVWRPHARAYWREAFRFLREIST